MNGFNEEALGVRRRGALHHTARGPRVDMQETALSAFKGECGADRRRAHRIKKRKRSAPVTPPNPLALLPLPLTSSPLPQSHSSGAPPAKRARTVDNLAMGMDLGMGMDGGDRGRRR